MMKQYIIELICVKIEEAEQRIRKLHPLYNMSLDQVFPSVACCFKCCRRGKKTDESRKYSLLEDEKNALKKLKELGLEDGERFDDGEDVNLNQNNANQDVKEDPYLQLGFGMCAYFNLLKTFIVVFIALTLLVLPIIGIYANKDGLQGWRNYERSRFSIGNMGFQESFFGNIVKLTSYGLIPSTLNSSKEINYCGTNPIEKIQHCTDKHFSTDFRTIFEGHCLNKNKCDRTFNLDTLILYESKDDGMSCTNKTSARFYIQYTCEEPDSEILIKKHSALAVACLGLFICFIFFCMTYYLSKTSYIDYKLWDVFTVTAADFTVEYTIPQQVWHQFCSLPDSNEGDSKAVAFEGYLKKQFEQIITNQEGVLSQENQEIRIANISFAFDNCELISKLKTRGFMIGNGQYNKLDTVDQQIDRIKETQIQRIVRPVAAFITFETQEGYERACNLKEKRNIFCQLQSKLDFLGQPLAFTEATEPTNIIWENRYLNDVQRFMRKLIVAVLVGIFLALTVFIFFLLKKATIDNQQKYPPSKDCDQIRTLFKDINVLAQVAATDKDPTLDKRGTGVYQCYCANKGKDSDLCDQYRKDMLLGTFLSTLVSLLTVIINIILRTINIKLISLIGYTTESGQTQAVMKSVFFSQFLNTAILLLLVNGNTQQTFLRFLGLDGQFPDFTLEWYVDIGPALVQTMFIAAIFPAIEFAYGYPMKVAFRLLDSGCKKGGPKKTKKNTIQQYVNLYAGPDHLLHFKYSSVMNVTFVTFMYGLALPLLFPIALLAFLVLYITEKLTITYYYKKPPMYDQKMNEAAIGILKWAPFFMMIFGFWQLGNMQIFSHEIGIKDYATDPVVTNHDIQLSGDQALPLFIFAIIFFACLFFNDLIFGLLVKGNICESQEEDEVDEQLGSYFECLTPYQRKIWFYEEKHLQRTLKITTIDDYAKEKLRSSKSGQKQIRDVKILMFNKIQCYNYEILTNQKYADAFQFTPLDMRDTPEEKEASDMVMRLLLIAYSKDGSQDAFKFSNNNPKGRRSTKKKVIN
ncbi:UNKNOWN [Stylonychia lemnae]|uniref:CSC1/OSCA1-like cytosolic domain-containing protein n=1 Tax=Stylonychia lemnae TaxID=5949 RepID=A0A078B6J6_STYLE|nr:UNKNOWN [Stylonychia lemnae]|eukprot:CDW90155.1 UNKNOWN [Stylonychia lemnae]